MDEITKNLYSYIEIDDYSGFVRYISSVIIKNNIKIDNCCFQYLVESNNLCIIQKLIENDLIINLDFCFDIFFEHFVKNLKSKEQIVFDIYVKFDNKINTENNSFMQYSSKERRYNLNTNEHIKNVKVLMEGYGINEKIHNKSKKHH